MPTKPTNLLDKKLEYWEHQLLDLGKRNKMINYRETKRTTLKLVEPAFGELFNRIALNEETLTFQRAVDRETDIRVFSMLSLLEHLSTSLPVTIGDIKAEGSILERQRTLNNLRSKARLSLEEQGTNILYLSFGFIEWKEDKGTSAQWIKSPLVLVPTVLTLAALNSPYSLSKHEDDIIVNPTLEYYLKTEYGIELPNFDVDKDTLENYFKSLEEIADQRGWRIVKEVSLGLLSFLKISMYNDLIRNEERIKRNPVIRAMSGNADEANDIPDQLRTFYLDLIRTQDCYQVMSADSSQQEAILYSKNNISFVMQGPPGTGKSQTITNIIAEALAGGKKVLFVSEKMAALQVVYRRLQDAHLADFCLPLHSYKANKKEILEQIGANLKLKQTRVKDTAIANLEELLSIRQELNKYADQLHTINPELNISCYEAYSKLEEVNDADNISFRIDNVLSISQSQLQLCLNKIKEYALALHRLNYYIKNNPWEGLSSRMSGYEYSDKMRIELSSFSQILSRLNDALCQIQENPSIATSIQYSALEEFTTLLAEVSKLPQVPEAWLQSMNSDNSIALAKEAKVKYSNLFLLKQKIAEVFTDEIFNYDYNNWKNVLLDDANGFIDLPLIKEKSEDFYIKNSSTVIKAFLKLKKYFESVYECFDNINSLLGTSFVANEVNQHVVAILVEIMQEDIPLHKKWFELETKKVKAIVKEAQTLQNQIDEQKQKILINWETEILELDYAPILLRYKTDYTSSFRFFNSQYKQDKKRIKALSKTVIKKLSDEVAVDLLNELKVYHDKASWFVDMDAVLKDSIGNGFTGIYSDWNLIIKGVCNVEKLRELSFEIPERMIEIVSKSHIESTQKLSIHVEKIISTLWQVKEIINNYKLDIDIASPEFDVQYTIDLLDKYVIGFDSLIAQSNLLTPFLLNGDEQIEKVYDAIGNLNDHNNIADKIAVDMEEYQQQYGFYFHGEKTDWDYLISVLNEINSIKQSAIFSFVKPLINVTNDRKVELNEISEQVAKFYSEGNNALEWLQQQFSDRVCLSELTFTEIVNKINSCLSSIELLEKWIDYQETKDDCICNGLSDFISKIETEEHFKDIEKCFLKGFYHMWLGSVWEKSTSVRRFRRNTQDERIKKFIELDDIQLLIAQMRIREKLIENLPLAHHMLKATDEV